MQKKKKKIDQQVARISDARAVRGCNIYAKRTFNPISGARGRVNKRHLSPGIMHFVFYALRLAAAAVALCRRFMLRTVRAYECVDVIATPTSDLGHDR